MAKPVGPDAGPCPLGVEATAPRTVVLKHVLSGTSEEGGEAIGTFLDASQELCKQLGEEATKWWLTAKDRINLFHSGKHDVAVCFPPGEHDAAGETSAQASDVEIPRDLCAAWHRKGEVRAPSGAVCVVEAACLPPLRFHVTGTPTSITADDVVHAVQRVGAGVVVCPGSARRLIMTTLRLPASGSDACPSVTVLSREWVVDVVGASLPRGGVPSHLVFEVVHDGISRMFKCEVEVEGKGKMPVLPLCDGCCGYGHSYELCPRKWVSAVTRTTSARLAPARVAQPNRTRKPVKEGCFKCGERGHVVRDCPAAKRKRAARRKGKDKATPRTATPRQSSGRALPKDAPPALEDRVEFPPPATSTGGSSARSGKRKRATGKEASPPATASSRRGDAPVHPSLRASTPPSTPLTAHPSLRAGTPPSAPSTAHPSPGGGTPSSAPPTAHPSPQASTPPSTPPTLHPLPRAGTPSPVPSSSCVDDADGTRSASAPASPERRNIGQESGGSDDGPSPEQGLMSPPTIGVRVHVRHEAERVNEKDPARC